MTIRSAIDLAAGVPWLITEDGLSQVLAIAERAQHDEEAARAIAAARDVSPEALAMRGAERLAGTRTVTLRDGVAVVPVTGPIFRYANLFSMLSGATSLQVVAADFQAALEADSVKAIVLQLDTPGGEARGIAEFAAAVRAANATKPVVAYAGDMAASAGYWIASAAGQVVLSQTALVGSIGARMAMRDSSMRDAASGIREIHIVSSNAPLKGTDPTSAQGQAQILEILNALETEFIAAVAAGRGVSVDTVKSEFGRGGLVASAADAVSRGMADRIGSFETVIRDLAAAGSPRKSSNPAAAAARLTGATMNPREIAAKFAAENPEAAETLRADGFQRGETAGKAGAAAAVTEALAAERVRIARIDALALPGHADLVAKAKADGMSAGDFAVAQTEAEKQKGPRKLEALKGDDAAVGRVDPAATTANDKRPAADDQRPLEERAQAAWDGSKELRAEFGDNFTSYLAFRRADERGQVRVLRGKESA